MDYESDDDAFPTRVLIDVIDGMVTHMFTNVKRKDDRPLIDNGLIIQTDDVLLYTTSGQDEAASEAKMLEILELFLHTVSCHDMSMHPSKCELFTPSTTYCGLQVTRQGIYNC